MMTGTLTTTSPFHFPLNGHNSFTKLVAMKIIRWPFNKLFSFFICRLTITSTFSYNLIQFKNHKRSCFDHGSSYWCFSREHLIELISTILFFIFCHLKESNYDLKPLESVSLPLIQQSKWKLRSRTNSSLEPNDVSKYQPGRITKANIRLYYPTLTCTLLAIISTFSCLNRKFDTMIHYVLSIEQSFLFFVFNHISFDSLVTINNFLTKLFCHTIRILFISNMLFTLDTL